MNGSQRVWRKRIAYFALLLCLISAFAHLFRAFWFDEVLTLDNFVLYPKLSRIYFLYEIPNNHIVFSMLEKIWIGFLALFSDSTPFFLFRGLSVLAGASAVWILAGRMVRSCGLYAGGITALAFAASSACGVFMTGIRGYMLGFLFTVLLLMLGEKLLKRPAAWTYLFFFLVCLLSVGTTPSNLAALTGAALFYAPALLRRRRYGSILFFFASPFAALILFYAPIHEKFFQCMRLGEGWFSAESAMKNLYLSFALVLAGLLPFCLAGAFLLWKRIPRLRLSCVAGLLLFLLPLPAFFVFRAPAFPRVFFPLFPLWLLLAGYALSAYLKARTVERNRGLRALPLVLQLLCTAFLANAGGGVSDFLFGSGRHDDLTLPYYARNGFDPQKIVSLVQEKAADGEHPLVFVTFDADYPSILFPGSCTDLPENTFLTDLPNKPPIANLDFHTGSFYFVTAGEADLERAMRRFSFTNAAPVWIGVYQRLDRVTR